MNRKTLSAVIAALLALAALPLAAAETVPGEPGEPEIVLAPVILEIEDLSVERVEARLPPEEDLLPPARDVLLVDVGDLVIADPSVPTSPVGSGAPGASRDRLIATDVRLGAGTANAVTGSVALKTLAGQPRFSLDFTHETMDGSTVNPLAPGFGRRTDRLAGALGTAPGPVEAGLTGSFSEEGAGLQGLSPTGQFLTRLARTVEGTASVSVRPAEWLRLAAALEASADTLRLEGWDLLQESEYRISPSLSAAASFKAVRLGLDARYAFRSSTPAGGSRLHRISAGLSLEADLPAALILNGSVGWYGSSAGAALAASLVPFELRLTGTPLPFLSLSAGGGYRVTPQDMRDVLALSPLVLPAAPSQDAGWFADGSLRLTFTRDLSASTKVSFSTASAALDAGTTVDAGTGLYPVAARLGNRLTTDFGARWAISQEISVSAGLAHEWLPLTVLAPVDRLLVELAALQAAGRWGGDLSVDWSVPQPLSGIGAQWPILRVSGFYAVSDVVTLQLGAMDLLAPLNSGGARVGFGGYAEPGFRVTASVRMSF